MPRLRHRLQSPVIALTAVLGFTWSAVPVRAEPLTISIIVAKSIAYLFGAAKVAGAAKGAAATGVAAKGTVVIATTKGAAAAAASKGSIALSVVPMTPASQALIKTQTTNLAPRLTISNVSKGLVHVGNFSLPVGKITLALGGLGLLSGEAQAYNRQVISEIAAAAELKQPYYVKVCRAKNETMYALPSSGEFCMDGSKPLLLEVPLDAAALAQ